MSFSNKIDKIANVLQEKGLNHLALDLDLVSNTLDKYAFKGDDVQGAIDTTMADLQRYPLKSAVWGIVEALAIEAERGYDIRKDFSHDAESNLGRIIYKELRKEGFSDSPMPFVGFDLQNFKKAETREEVKHMVDNLPHVLVFMAIGDLHNQSVYNSRTSSIKLYLTSSLVEAFHNVLKGSKARMSDDPYYFHSLKPMLWIRVLDVIRGVVTHELTHAYQHARVVRGEEDDSKDKEWFEKSRQRPGQEIRNYRHPTLDVETEAVREQVESELKGSVKLYSPARVDKLIVPEAIHSTLFADWREHDPDDVKGVYRAMTLLEKDQLLSSAILKAWREYLQNIQGVLQSSRKEIPTAVGKVGPNTAKVEEALDWKRQLEDYNEDLRKRFQGVDLKPYLDWNPQPNMLSNKRLVP